MKTLNNFIFERLKLNKNTKIREYHFFPKNFDDLRELLEQLLDERGKDADLNDIDISEINTFYDINTNLGLFEHLDPHNIDISLWDVSNVESMIGTFYMCHNFTGQGLENWSPIKCKDISYMFQHCYKFDCNLGNWDVSNVVDMSCMFFGCKKFTGQGLENWKPIKCTNMSYMFDSTEVKKYPSWYKI